MNKVCLSGRVSKVIGLSQNKKSFMYQLATKDSNYIKGDTEFITCVCFGSGAKWGEKFLKKGTLVSVEGRIHSKGIKQDDGSYKNFVCVIATSHELLGAKKEEAQSNINEKELPVPFELANQVDSQGSN